MSDAGLSGVVDVVEEFSALLSGYVRAQVFPEQTNTLPAARAAEAAHFHEVTCRLLRALRDLGLQRANSEEFLRRMGDGVLTRLDHREQLQQSLSDCVTEVFGPP